MKIIVVTTFLVANHDASRAENSNKRSPTSLIIKGASSIDFKDKVELFSKLESEMLSIAINNRQNLIKKLICQNKQETSERNSLTVKDKIAMKKHYSKKLLFYKEQDLKKWNLWPNKLTN